MTWNEERFAPSCNRNNWDTKKAGRPVASRLKPTGRARWAGSGPLFRLTAHCLYEEASPPWDLCAFADSLSRETAPSFFLYGSSLLMSRESSVLDANLKGAERDSSRRGKAHPNPAAARALRWSDNSGRDRCPRVRRPTCIDDAPPRLPERKHVKAPAHY